MKVFIEFAFLNKWMPPAYKTSLPILAGINLSWHKYDFSLPDEGGVFPKGIKEGRLKFVVSAAIMYWRITINFYKPRTFPL
jgi:hypothetical protein